MRVCAHCGSQVPDGADFCPRCNKLPAGPIAPARGSSKSVYLVLGCVLVPVFFAVLGIVAALIVPNFLDALQKARQKRAVIELQTIGQAVEAYKAEHDYAPAATDLAGLAAALGPGSPIPRLDPWQHPFRYACWQESPSEKGCDHYRIASAGRDGKFEHLDLRAYEAAAFVPTEYDRDIVYGDGAFVVRPGRK
ncbi:MAG TPA: type II secretion system protein GspG [Thermoanaerobaculia bacterium]|nr:type II secretion system protein GspG [Thermoanaerobaculia bacterium]